MSAIFYHDDAQLAAIERTAEQHVQDPDQIRTEVAKLDRFWIAEDYHQKYRLRHSPLLEELQAYYEDEAGFVASTAAARVNGYLDGFGSREQLARELDQLGLSERGRAELQRYAR